MELSTLPRNELQLLLSEETPSRASLAHVAGGYGDLRPFSARASYRQPAAHLLDTLAHADETKAIMAIGGGESFTIILEFQSKFLPTLRRASNRPA